MAAEVGRTQFSCRNHQNFRRNCPVAKHTPESKTVVCPCVLYPSSKRDAKPLGERGYLNNTCVLSFGGTLIPLEPTHVHCRAGRASPAVGRRLLPAESPRLPRRRSEGPWAPLSPAQETRVGPGIRQVMLTCWFPTSSHTPLCPHKVEKLLTTTVILIQCLL